MIKNTYKKRKRRETFGKKALTVGGIVTAGVIEAKTGYKVTGAIGKGASKAVSAAGTAGRKIKTFGGNVKKSFTDSFNPKSTESKKIPKSRRLNAANLQPDKLTPKPKLLPAGSGVDKPPTIHRGQGEFGVIKGATKKTRNRPKAKPVLHGSYSDPLRTKGQTIGGRKLSKLTVKSPTIGIPTGPGTKSGSFKPKLSVDSKLMSDYQNIEKTKTSAKKRQTNLIKNAPGKAMEVGDTQGVRRRARDSVAKKVKASRKRTSTRVANIGKSIENRAKQIAKTTGRTVEKVKAINKKLSTPSGRAALSKAFRGTNTASVAATLFTPTVVAVKQSGLNKPKNKKGKSTFTWRKSYN